jgi:CPA2 family monovalent cation:H+ antiporter-2
VDDHVPLIATIAVGIALAFIGGMLAAKARLSPLVGYLLAGIAVGPFTPGFVADAQLAAQLAEIGVILLMFGVGMHFSLRDLMEVRGIALPGAIVQIGAAVGLGLAATQFWGWSLPAGLVFGLALSVASTVVLLRALAQRGMLDSLEGRIAVGWLVVEDLVMVMALVLLPTLALSWSGSDGIDLRALGFDLVILLIKIGLFFLIMHFIGVRLFPWLFAQVAHAGSRDLVTLFVVTVGLGVAYGSARLFGVSFALGAFFAGVVINESRLAERVASEVQPLENAFAVLFFVSVGMLFDPHIVVAMPFQLVVVLGIVVAGKSLAALLIVLAFRYPLRAALTVSASLAQIGEFSFILGALGVSLGLFPREAQTLILAGALFSIAFNPLVFATIDPVQKFVSRHPVLAHLVKRLQRAPEIQAGAEQAARMRDHVVLVGYGRVGQSIAEQLRAHSIPHVVVEQNREMLRELEKHATPAVPGDGSIREVLERANPATARLLVSAVPDVFHAVRILDHARRVNPLIDAAVRTHSTDELAFVQARGVGIALMAERELAHGLAEYVVEAYRQRHAPQSSDTNVA